jgi:hypothetical protein
MSDTYSQPAFGQPTFIESSASGSLSGRDDFRAMDATAFYNTDDHDYSRSHLHDLHISSPDAFSAGQQFSFASHNTSGVSLPGKHATTTSSYQFWHYIISPVTKRPFSLLGTCPGNSNTAWLHDPRYWVAPNGMTFIWIAIACSTT